MRQSNVRLVTYCRKKGHNLDLDGLLQIKREIVAIIEPQGWPPELIDQCLAELDSETKETTDGTAINFVLFWYRDDGDTRKGELCDFHPRSTVALDIEEKRYHFGCGRIAVGGGGGITLAFTKAAGEDTEMSSGITIRTFQPDFRELDSLLIYRRMKFLWQKRGIVLSQEINAEVSRFLAEYLGEWDSDDLRKKVYFRIDLFPDFENGRVFVIEINAQFVDGWGIGLLLSRLAGSPANIPPYEFPLFWHLPNRSADYRGEFELAMREISRATGKDRIEIAEPYRADYYRWGRSIPAAPFVPVYQGLPPTAPSWLDWKLRLAEMAATWKSDLIKIPPSYTVASHPWEALPRDKVIFKFVDKYGWEAQVARRSVLYPKDVGKGKFIRKAYGDRSVIAQDILACNEIDGEPCQIEILTHGTKPITGYCLFAPKGTKIINDSYVHAPLILES